VKGAGGWQGFTYQWRSDGSDADLLTDGQFTKAWSLTTGGTYTHVYPSRSQCLSCHESSFGPMLGLRTEQLRRWYDYGGVIADQLATLQHLGIGPASATPALPSPHDASLSVVTRTRGYMAANCAHCHNPAHIAIKDLRITTPLARTRLCEVIAPGRPLDGRLHQLVTARPGMPAIGSLVPDPLIGSLVNTWITGMTSCPLEIEAQPDAALQIEARVLADQREQRADLEVDLERRRLEREAELERDAHAGVDVTAEAEHRAADAEAERDVDRAAARVDGRDEVGEVRVAEVLAIAEVVDAEHDVERAAALEIDLEIEPGGITEEESDAEAIGARGSDAERQHEDRDRQSSHAAMVDRVRGGCEVRGKGHSSTRRYIMGHRIDRGDVIDMLEESITLRIPVVVELRDGRRFEDRVTQIGKYAGEDHVAFHDHEFTPLRQISRTARAVPREYTYAGKR